MDNQFTRSLLGFMLLTAGLATIIGTALWGLERYPVDNSNWPHILIIFIGLVSQVLIYANTVHGPIARWIKEPEIEREYLKKNAQWQKDYHRLSEELKELKGKK